MPKIIPALTDTQVRTAKPKDKDYKLCDAGGLRLLIRKTGTKVWQFPYKYDNKANVYTIGQYPLVTLAEAREKRDVIRKMLLNGTDPNNQKKAEKIVEANSNSFEAIAREWHSKQLWVDKHAQNILMTLEKDVFPSIGPKPIADVTVKDILDILFAIERRGALDVAKRVCQRCTSIFDYAILKGLMENNPALGRSKLIKPVKTKHRPYLAEKGLPEYLAKLEQYHGRKIVKYALKLLLLTFIRPGELRYATWNEFDLEKAEWRISADRMKMGRPHVIPLSIQAVALLKELHSFTGNKDLLFPGIRSWRVPISDVTLLKALKIMGYTGDKKIVPHGFRATASTILNERGKFRPDVIERQLAHVEDNKVRAAYHHAEYLDERKEMMQWWANYIDKHSGTKEFEKASILLDRIEPL